MSATLETDSAFLGADGRTLSVHFTRVGSIFNQIRPLTGITGFTVNANGVTVAQVEAIADPDDTRGVRITLGKVLLRGTRSRSTWRRCRPAT